jgi:pimeloyl-ACP methyl ester carboxylesterase
MATAMLTGAQEQRVAGAKIPPHVIEKQGSFFIGGHDIYSETLTNLDGSTEAGTITVDQVYVHYQIPVDARRHPLTLIHGCCLTGKTWETTPDGRMGWDEYFVREGYATYVIDQAARGRSAGNATAASSAKLPTARHAAHEGAWVIFRFGPEYPKVFPGMQFPLEAQSEFWKQMVPDWNATLPTPNPTVTALSELAQRLGGTVLISHSQSGIFPFQTAALSAKGIAGIVSIEPGACPAASVVSRK